MLVAGQLDSLRDAVGDDGLSEGEPLEIDGVAPALRLRPADGAALSRLLAALGRAGLAVLVRGGGHRMQVGNPPARADAILCTERLVGVDEFDPSEGVCHARSGTRLCDLQERVAADGWELPLDPPGRNSTVGGCVAAASLGPRALGFGTPRDVVLGLEVVLASGQRTRCGGRVVKNVTGYDLNKLYTGSFGALGVIEGAWLRLRPRPARVACLRASRPDVESASRDAVEAARRTGSRVAALRSVDGHGWELAVELAGDAPAVERDQGELGAAGWEAAPGAEIDRIRERQGETPAPSGLRFRVGVLPSRLEGALVELRDLGASLLAYPGLRLLYASFALDESRSEPGAADAFAAVARVARAAGGSYVCEAAPAWAKTGREMFGEAAAATAIARALKRRFDPEGVLNPGRLAGGV